MFGPNAIQWRTISGRYIRQWAISFVSRGEPIQSPALSSFAASWFTHATVWKFGFLLIGCLGTKITLDFRVTAHTRCVMARIVSRILVPATKEWASGITHVFDHRPGVIGEVSGPGLKMVDRGLCAERKQLGINAGVQLAIQFCP
jgi:hypothetical protein